MKPITIWAKWNKPLGEFEHNHIEDGHAEADRPVGHTSWVNGDWKRTHAWLTDMASGMIQFKRVTALEFIMSLKPAIPLSKEKPCSKENSATFPSGSELRRWCKDSSVVINGKKVKHDDLIEFPITSLVFFPKSDKSRCTLY